MEVKLALSGWGRGLQVGDISKIERAVEGFVHGLCYCRSFTYPYWARRVGPLWVARDAPRDSGNYRNEEWVAFGVEPGVVDKIVQREARGRFAICEIHPVGEADVMMRQ